MSTYTPCFPSTSSAASVPVSFSARLSKAHLALASVSDYIVRPPSPTSAAVDLKRVDHIRRKFRLAVAAAYRDTSSGKWAHVSELATLGCTIGRWQGVCSGSKTPHPLCPPSAGDRNDQGVAQPEVNPYPRPPVPIFDPSEIRERVENWQANVVSAPLSQADSQHPNSMHSIEHAEQLSPLNFPTVKRRKSDIAKAMKRKRKASPDRDYTTSRYFRGDGLADRMSPQPVNRGAGRVTRSVPRSSNAELTPQSRAESPDEDPEIVPTPAAITASVPENIHQITEAFLPPSFPSQLQTSTPPPARDRLIKPPVIPHAEGLFLSTSLASPPPFPRSQPDFGSASQPLCTPAPHARSRQDIPSPAGSPSSPAGLAPVIDLRRLAATSSQRSRDSLSRHPTRVFALGSSPMTPRTARRPEGKDRGKGKDTARALSSPPLLALPGPPHLHSQTQTPPLSPVPDFTRHAHAFAPAATSTQQPHAHGSQPDIFGLEAPGNDVDVAALVRDMPVIEAEGDVDADVGVDVGKGGEERKSAGERRPSPGPSPFFAGIVSFGRDGACR